MVVVQVKRSDTDVFLVESTVTESNDALVRRLVSRRRRTMKFERKDLRQRENAPVRSSSTFTPQAISYRPLPASMGTGFWWDCRYGFTDSALVA